jgi:hypothetical protein
MNHDHMPGTIVEDRYGGTFSGGAWVAYGNDFAMVPREANGDDNTCMDFWDEVRRGENDLVGFVGLGDTPQEAIDDYKAKSLESAK